MGEFSNLMADEATFLAALCREYVRMGSQAFVVSSDRDGTFLVPTTGGGDRPRVSDGETSQALLDAIERTGYITITRHGGYNVRPTTKATEYIAYAAKGRIRRHWQDLAYELGHNETLRSKLWWATGSVLVSGLIAYAREIVTFLRGLL